eukprot:TRINITY_DN1780_c0_g3_i1.p1 TRINITY_DN1780_c0_g3~~TRINITY_DN1780_c0_g3_i1.p1  ORF type:complete len:217 (-),score=62.81 TRINITY_DN1780_c0_g3_i1:807-1412(-)
MSEAEAAADEKVSPVDEKETWDSLNIPRFDQLEVAISQLHWTWPLPVQVQTLPIIFESPVKNIIAQAPTGKGKTGAFAIGMVCKCDPGLEEPQVLCLAPTREIANQTADHTLAVLGNALGLKVFKAIKDAVVESPISAQIIVGTPGTVAMFIKNGMLKLNKIQVLVIDEADTMVEKDMDMRAQANDKKRKDMTRTVLDIKK